MTPTRYLNDHLVALANAARSALERVTSQHVLEGLESFPRGTCGQVSDLMGHIVLDHTGRSGLFVCGDAHPALKHTQSHAWLDVDGIIVDLTHDQFAGTGLAGWVFERSPWHQAFRCEPTKMDFANGSLSGYSMPAYSAMVRACEQVIASDYGHTR